MASNWRSYGSDSISRENISSSSGIVLYMLACYVDIYVRVCLCISILTITGPNNVLAETPALRIAENEEVLPWLDVSVVREGKKVIK